MQGSLFCLQNFLAKLVLVIEEKISNAILTYENMQQKTKQSGRQPADIQQTGAAYGRVQKIM